MEVRSVPSFKSVYAPWKYFGRSSWFIVETGETLIMAAGGCIDEGIRTAELIMFVQYHPGGTKSREFKWENLIFERMFPCNETRKSQKQKFL